MTKPTRNRTVSARRRFSILITALQRSKRARLLTVASCKTQNVVQLHTLAKIHTKDKTCIVLLHLIMSSAGCLARMRKSTV